MAIDPDRPFKPIRIAVLTVSDTRSLADDTSGDILVERLTSAGHELASREISRDSAEEITAHFHRWIDDEMIDVIITTGGTGLTGRDSTPEAIRPLLDKEIAGFGELFRMLSWEEIGASTLQSRALGGLANATLIFCLPGSTGACRTGWDRILQPQLDARTRPCNLVELLPRLQER